MMLWIVFAAMTALAVATVLHPLVTGRARAHARARHEVAVYRDQLLEIDRDRGRGVISDGEAEGARAEIARRLIAADERHDRGPPPATAIWRRSAAVLVIVLLPGIALGSYLALGSPGAPSQPFAARQEAPLESQDLATLVGRVEQHLQQDPTDAAGWDAVAPAYMRLGRFRDAADAYGRAIRLGGETAERQSALGEARLFLTGGMVDAAARAAFERASALDPSLPSPRFYLGLAAKQDGDVDRARALWEELVASAPPRASWADEVRRQIAGLAGGEAAAAGRSGSEPGPGAEDVAAAASLSAEERGAMIEGMVDGLAARLADAPDDLDGWLRLARAYVVLGRQADARAALDSARDAFTGRDDPLARIEAAARELGLGS